METKEECKNCRFWIKTGVQEQTGCRGDKPDKWRIGLCRRYPKTFVMKTKSHCFGIGLAPRYRMSSSAKYPPMREDEWCGEFKEKESELKEPTPPPVEEYSEADVSGN